MQKEITENLCMSKIFNTISTNTIRENIKLTVSKRSASTGGHNTAEDSFEKSLKPVISELCLQFEKFERTIVYSKLKYCAMGFELVKREAMKISPEDVTQIMNAVFQYHAPSTTKVYDNMINNNQYSTCIIYSTYGVYTCSQVNEYSIHDFYLKMKEKTVHKMCDPSSHLKLLFATEAYSMWTNAPNIRQNIHFCSPSSC